MEEKEYTCNTCARVIGSEKCDICTINEDDPYRIPSYWVEKKVHRDSSSDAEHSKKDVVNHPEHYQTESGLETIDVIEAFTNGLDGIEAVCTGNVIKYVCRWKKKNGLEDLKKAKWYLGRLIHHIEKIEEKKGENRNG